MDDINNDQNPHLTADGESSGILDAVTHSQQSEILRTVNPVQSVYNLLDKVSEREKDIIIKRYGLENGSKETLEQIGSRLGLTRERVRQIEKETIKKLRAEKKPPDIESITDLIMQILEENQGIATEEKIVTSLLQNVTDSSKSAIIFLLDLSADIDLQKDTNKYEKSWYTDSFSREEFEQVIGQAVKIFKKKNKPLEVVELKKSLRKSAAEDLLPGDSEVLENFLEVTKKIDQNKFGRWGLTKWPEITPKDVGDKSYLVLKNHGEPAHYDKITELINKQDFDKRIAHKETVHNELIKDDRFVLVGRGIYALKEWGYKRGTVADIIEYVLKQAGEPLERQELIDRVLKQRKVKKNTVAVGLSNKDRFIKTSDNKYTLAQNDNETNV